MLASRTTSLTARGIGLRWRSKQAALVPTRTATTVAGAWTWQKTTTTCLRQSARSSQTQRQEAPSYRFLSSSTYEELESDENELDSLLAEQALEDEARDTNGRDVLSGIIKIFSVCSTPSYILPWQNKPLHEGTGSGFAISGRRILTNAHVVADEKYVRVRKLGSPKKFHATVQFVSHECDLAVLSVADPAFWVNVPALELGSLPYIQEEVTVVGYPIGGDSLSVTQGVVSRVEPQHYIHGGLNLLAVQIDASINPGNSGCPAFKGDKVIGVAFQSLQNATNVGYIIPVPVVEHFLKDCDTHAQKKVTNDNGDDVRWDGRGFCLVGVTCQSTENPGLQAYVNMDALSGQAREDGVVVIRVDPVSAAAGKLFKNDVILEIDGNRVACDGTVAFRNRERISFDYLITQKFANDNIHFKVFRDGQLMDVTFTVQPTRELVPFHQYDETPRYFIFAGLVFVPLSHSYILEAQKKHGYNQDLHYLAANGMPKTTGEEAVVLSQVLMHDVNIGYQDMVDGQITKLNGVDVVNLEHLKELVEAAVQKRVEFLETQGSERDTPSDESTKEDPNRETGYMIMTLKDERFIVLDIDPVLEVQDQILRKHRIPANSHLGLLH